VTLSDAGGGAGDWTVTALGLTTPPTITVPGTLTITVTASTTVGDHSGFVVLSRGTDARRIPYWYETTVPKLASEPATTLTKPGSYSGTTVGGKSLITTYRYPTAGDRRYPGPERVFRIHLTTAAANAGVVVLSGNVFPHITLDGSEDRLAGYTALPLDLNPYRQTYGAPRKVSGVVLPAAGTYDVVFDSTGTGGRFTFRYWVNDTKPPTLRVASTNGGIVVSATDAGSGVDPLSIVATVDGKTVRPSWADGRITIPATKGRHALVLTVSDIEETKNMEDVPPILPNTATLRAAVSVR
jgi:hypothetical protein